MYLAYCTTLTIFAKLTLFLRQRTIAVSASAWILSCDVFRNGHDAFHNPNIQGLPNRLHCAALESPRSLQTP